MSALMLTGCEQSIPQEQKDWENATTYFNASDEATSTTYYIPSAGSAGDPLPFYDPVAKEYKILYLHNFEQNQEETFHPLWGVRTTDCATYSPMGEVLPTGLAGEHRIAMTGRSAESDGFDRLDGSEGSKGLDKLDRLERLEQLERSERSSRYLCVRAKSSSLCR